MSKHDLIREAFENDAGVEVIPRDKNTNREEMMTKSW